MHKWRILSLIIWIAYLGVAIGSYLRHHDNLSICMIVLGVLGILIGMRLLRADH